MKRSLAVLFAVLCTTAVFAGDGSIQRSRRPADGQYIIRLKPGAGVADSLAAELVHLHGGSTRYIYRGGSWEGFAADHLPAAAAEAISRDPRVLDVTEATVVQVLQTAPPANWANDRINQHLLPLDTLQSWHTASATIYVFDTGINHAASNDPEFGSRVIDGWTKTAGDFADHVNHGTSVASIIGGNNWGVARWATLVSVKVVATNTYTDTDADAIAAIRNFIIPDSQSRAGREVVNASVLYNTTSTLLDSAVLDSIATGTIWVCGAGNTGADACNAGTPARLGRPDANGRSTITVGASMIDDAGTTDSRAVLAGWWQSNIGQCVDIFAPGSYVDAIDFNGAYTKFHGTSSASPYVAGEVAYYAYDTTTFPTAADVENQLKSVATAGVLDPATLGDGSPNLLLYQFRYPKRRAV